MVSGPARDLGNYPYLFPGVRERSGASYPPRPLPCSASRRRHGDRAMGLGKLYVLVIFEARIAMRDNPLEQPRNYLIR
jgi:hypothetical protein